MMEEEEEEEKRKKDCKNVREFKDNVLQISINELYVREVQYPG